jgi:uncharacterized membrane protein
VGTFPVDHHGLAGKRLVVATLVGVGVLVATLLAGAVWVVAVTLGWDAAALMFVGWVWASVAGKDAAETSAHAQADDVSRAAADAILLSASLASLIALGFLLVEAGHRSGTAKGLLIALAIVSVALAWGAVQTVFALRYGDLYYREPIGGIDFHNPEPPDYRDFAYVALTVGMTFQVSDTDLTTKPIRRTAIRHALIGYLFSAVIVAMAINIVASLLNR